jgi:hypothetical protein
MQLLLVLLLVLQCRAASSNHDTRLGRISLLLVVAAAAAAASVLRPFGLKLLHVCHLGGCLLESACCTLAVLNTAIERGLHSHDLEGHSLDR